MAEIVMLGLILVLMLGLVAFIALGVDDTQFHEQEAEYIQVKPRISFWEESLPKAPRVKETTA